MRIGELAARLADKEEAEKLVKSGIMNISNTHMTCLTCEYGSIDESGDVYCVNGDSEYCSEWVGADTSCERWTYPAK